VLTTIFNPTEQVRKLSEIPGWQVVVVADTKTPSNWTLDNVIFLDINAQKQLGYKVLDILPWNSYTRKVIGYLYAIENGARFIYDTDDDNAPNEPIKFETNFVLKNTTRGLVTSNKNFLVNPYVHFGQKTAWPRGYPLDQISQAFNHSYSTCPMHTPLIQQGLVNGDPDVDAIFRMTRKFTKRLNIQFDGHAPPIIYPSSVFAPYNSQNTMFHYAAFWSLLLPISVTFRTTDIWRGYWAQPLLWKIGGHLGFYPPHTTQNRNSHVYLKDFGEEDQLYTQSGELVQFLSEWKCSETNENLYKCMLELTEAMVNRSMWGVSEMGLMQAWILDLKKIGYNEPGFQNREPCLTGTDKSVAVFHGVDTAAPLDKHRSSLREFCQLKSDTKTVIKFPDTLLVVTFNFPHYENIWLLDLIYRPHYPNIVYCGEKVSALEALTNSSNFLANGVKDLTVVNTLNINKGYHLYECALRAIDMKYSVNGYLVVSDDILLNFWNIGQLNPNEMWIQNRIKYRNMEIPLSLHEYDVANYAIWNSWTDSSVKAVTQVWKSKTPLVKEFCANLARNGLNSSMIGIVMSDMFYIPATKQEMYYDVGTVLWKAGMFLEMATALLADGLSKSENMVILTGLSIWDQARNTPFNSYNVSSVYLHPVKPSQVVSNPNLRREYCNKYVSRVLVSV